MLYASHTSPFSLLEYGYKIREEYLWITERGNEQTESETLSHCCMSPGLSNFSRLLSFNYLNATRFNSQPCLQFSQSRPTPSCTAYLSVLDGARKKWVSLAVSCTAGNTRLFLTSSLIPPWEKSWSEKVSLGTELCNLGGGMIWIK